MAATKGEGSTGRSEVRTTRKAAATVASRPTKPSAIDCDFGLAFRLMPLVQRRKTSTG